MANVMNSRIALHEISILFAYSGFYIVKTV